MAVMFFLIIFIIWAAFMAFLIGSIVFWVFMLIDVLRRSNWHDENEKILWIVLLLLVGQIGAIVYYFAIYRERGKAVAAPAPVVAAPAAVESAVQPPAETPTKSS
jgi:uncharacterized membrane protein